MQHETLGK